MSDRTFGDIALVAIAIAVGVALMASVLADAALVLATEEWTLAVALGLMVLMIATVIMILVTEFRVLLEAAHK
jgi:uncharacterized membrane protein YcjF (UPF0283 family)